jgi:GntP family gluconate:H+ symporter
LFLLTFLQVLAGSHRIWAFGDDGWQRAACEVLLRDFPKDAVLLFFQTEVLQSPDLFSHLITICISPQRYSEFHTEDFFTQHNKISKERLVRTHRLFLADAVYYIQKTGKAGALSGSFAKRKAGEAMSGIPLILAFVAAILVMILAISKWKVHPFLAIMGVSVILALVAGIPLVDTPGADGTTISGIPTVIGAGFSGTFSSIGIVIILGALIGAILESTGAALKLADMVIGIVGKSHPELAIELMGWVVSIPVFCDSGFVILNPIRKALVKRTATSSVAMTVALSAGLYISHVLIPPTPGPIAAASTLGIGDNLLLVMGLGALCSIFPLIAGYFFALYIGKKVKSSDETCTNGEAVKTYEELVAEHGRLPGGANALAPILVPILLMALGSIAAMADWSGPLGDLCVFLGKPIMALGAGTLFAVGQMATAHKMSDFYKVTDSTLKTVGPILFVTAAGGVLGKVIAASSMVSFITANADALKTVGIFFPFLLAAILKSAQGSSTVAITTTAGIVAPLMGALSLDTPVLAALTVMAIGTGAMTVSHANDSYFWVVTNFGDMTPEQGYKTQTMMTLVIGIASIVGIFLLSLVL